MWELCWIFIHFLIVQPWKNFLSPVWTCSSTTWLLHSQRLWYLEYHSHTHTHTPLQTRLIVEGGLKPIDGEGDDAGKDGRPTVDEGNSDGLALKVVVVLIVAGKRYKWPKTQTQREKDLSGSIDPCSRIGQLFQLKADTCTDADKERSTISSTIKCGD